jgi:nucleotide-binding universal stress UspA family protein
MFENIVVPLDGSGFSERAVGVAQWIAGQCGSHLHLVRVVVTPAEAAPDARLLARRDAQVYLDGKTWDLGQHGVAVHSAVLEGSAALAIADYADRTAADLIVMTTRGRTGAQRRQLGSVAGVVIHHATCPVLLVRERPGEPRPESQALFDHIVVAVDGAERADRVEALALQLGLMGHPQFRIMRTIPNEPLSVPASAPADDAQRSMRAEAERYACDVLRRLRARGLRANVIVKASDEPAKAILDVATGETADLIVLGMHADGESRTTPAAITEQLLRDTSLPLLVVREVS